MTGMMITNRFRRGYVDLPMGQIHVHGALESDHRMPLLMLHMTPLSSVVFENVLPLFSDHVRPIAIDTPGFGGSDQLRSPTIADYADVILEVADALGIERGVFLGQHTGASIATEIAVKAPDRISGLVLSGVAVVSEEDASRRLNSKRPYSVEESGSHIECLWHRSRQQHPRLSPDLATRHLAEELKAGPRAYLDAYTAVYTHPIEQRLREVAGLGTPVLLQYGSDDCIAELQTKAAELLPNADVGVLKGLTDFAADENPALFAAGISRFIAERVD